MREYRYYIAAGRSLEVCEKIRDQRQEAYEALKAIIAELGANNAFGQPRILSFTFDEGKAPQTGWKRAKRAPGYYPDRRTKGNGPLIKRIEAIRLPGSWELHTELGLEMCIAEDTGRGSVILSTSAETIGDKVILRVPLDHAGKHAAPPDAVPIKASEYWRMKEETGEAAAA